MVPVQGGEGETTGKWSQRGRQAGLARLGGYAKELYCL